MVFVFNATKLIFTQNKDCYIWWHEAFDVSSKRLNMVSITRYNINNEDLNWLKFCWAVGYTFAGLVGY